MGNTETRSDFETVGKGAPEFGQQTYFVCPPHHKMLHTNNNSLNNKKHYCQHLMIRRSCIKVQIPTFFFFFCKIQKSVTLVLNWCLLRSSRAGLWPPPSHGAALSKTSQFPPISVVSLRPNISSYLSSWFCHSFHKENEMSPIAMFLKSEKTGWESFQEKWVSLFVEVKNILTCILNDAVLLSWSLFHIWICHRVSETT